MKNERLANAYTYTLINQVASITDVYNNATNYYYDDGGRLTLLFARPRLWEQLSAASSVLSPAMSSPYQCICGFASVGAVRPRSRVLL
ncbi:hypothetical protein HZA56_14845 [Candidatus Poribacteria bacterium]|nr:hypothetical protein [Candidatus Poribacteria bacterium]